MIIRVWFRYEFGVGIDFASYCGCMYVFHMKEIPGAYKLPTEASVVKAAAGWAHCATVNGNAYLTGFFFSLYILILIVEAL